MCKMHAIHELRPNNVPRRRNFHNWFLQEAIGFDEKAYNWQRSSFSLK